MDKTIAFVTNQHRSDRIIAVGRKVADRTNTELLVVDILDSEYELYPQAVDYLFTISKKHGAIMRLIFSDQKERTMHELLSDYEVKEILTGMPASNKSVLYLLWKNFPEKNFNVVDEDGELVEVANQISVRHYI